MIKVLPKEVADKIAAGEVIESPVSIVKELVENSIDAGATEITCEITKGGKEEIRITDNGHGIPKDEVETAFLRHATSKISKAEDLKFLTTLGFRGEALASISAVSRTELITKTKDESVGTRIVIHGGKTISIEGIGCPVGTTIIIKDLFYNMPARAKFLKTEAAEAGKIIDMISRLAITKPDIRFSLISNGKTYFTTPGNNDLKTSIISVYKDRELNDLIEISHSSSDGEIKVNGFISRPSITRANRRSQFFFVNGRAIGSKIIEKGIDLGYKERLFEGRYPICFLFIEIDTTKLDVNVHPNKKEVRFDDDIKVITTVEEAIRNGITSERGVIKGTDSIITHNKESEKYVHTPSNKPKEEQLNLKELLSQNRPEESRGVAETKDGDFDYGTGFKPFDFDDLVFGDLIWGTYIIASDKDNLYLFDQHAAHERINYESFVDAYLSSNKESQILLTPFTIDVPLDMLEKDDEWISILNQMGYSVEAFGDNTYIFREIPVFVDLNEAEDFAKSFIDSYFEDIKDKNQVVIDKLITKACKASIKAHDYIKPEEVKALIEDLKKCKNPFSCPHGRPTFIKFNNYEIEKMFKRV